MPRKKSFLLKAIEFAFNLPYRVVMSIINAIQKLKDNHKKKKLQQIRDAIKAEYKEFEVIETESGNFKNWEKRIKKSTIGIILGARGKGKTAIGVKVLENISATTKKKIYALGFNEEDLPSWINAVDDIKKIGSNAVVLIDEGGVLFSSRKSMTNANQILSELILVSRHKSLSILFISQNSANLDVNILRQADYLVLKPSSLLQKDFERKKIKELYENVDFKKYSHKGITYIYSEEFRGFINNPLPSFWTMNISKSFKT